MVAKKTTKIEFAFYLYLNFCIGVFITLSSYYHVPLAYFKDYLMYALHFVLMQFTVFGFVYLLTLNKYLFYIVFAPLFFVTSLFSFWAYTLDVTVSKAILQSVFETKLDVALDLISLPFLVYIVFVCGILFSILKFYNQIQKNKRNPYFILVSLAAIFAFFLVEKNRYGTLISRLPYNLIFETKSYLLNVPPELTSLSTKNISISSDTQIVFVIGESVRADHLSLNGYTRNTMPILNKMKNIISFSKVFSPLTYTAISLPQILTNASVKDSEQQKKLYSIYSFLEKGEIKTVWIGNQTPERSYEAFIYQNSEVKLIDVTHSEFSFHKKPDKELIDVFKMEYLKSKKSFFTLHMMGSHWWYENRYTDEFRKYKPVIKSKHIPSNTSNEMINSYDNTILYLDSFLNDVITIIEKSNKKTILIYLSDHGEILGENGKWLHAQNDQASTNPAMLIWYSDAFEAAFPNKISAAKSKKKTNITTDFLFHSVLDLLQVTGFEFKKEESVFYLDTK